MVSELARDIDKQTQGVPGENGLLQKIHRLEEDFQLTIRKTAPDYRPYKRDTVVEGPRPHMPQLDFLDQEEDIVAMELQMSNEPIFIDDVMDQAHW
jgi:hypothetical protein